MSPGEYSRQREQNWQRLGGELGGGPSHEYGWKREGKGDWQACLGSWSILQDVSGSLSHIRLAEDAFRQGSGVAGRRQAEAQTSKRVQIKL